MKKQKTIYDLPLQQLLRKKYALINLRYSLSDIKKINEISIVLTKIDSELNKRFKEA